MTFEERLIIIRKIRNGVKDIDPEKLRIVLKEFPYELQYLAEDVIKDRETINLIASRVWDDFNADTATEEEIENIKILINKINNPDILALIKFEHIPILSSIIKSQDSLEKVEIKQLPQEIKQILKKRKLTFEDLKNYPHWKPYLRGKNCEELFEEKYKYEFRFLGDQVINVGFRDPETLEQMLDREYKMAIWYAKAKFIPSHIVMLNISFDDIDKFLQNKDKWAKLVGNADYQNDDAKLSLLKVCYALGVFENQKEGYETIDHLINRLPQQLEDQEYQKLEKIAGIETVYQKINEERYIFKRKEYLEALNHVLLIDLLTEKGIGSTVLTPEQYEELLKGKQNNNSRERISERLTAEEIRKMVVKEGDSYIVKSKANGYELRKKLLYQIGVKPDNPLTKEQYKQLDRLGAEYVKKIFTKQDDGTYKFNMRVEATGNGEVFLHEGQDLKNRNLEEISKVNKKLFDYTRVILQESGLITEANMLGANVRQNINMVLDEAQYNKVLREAEAIKEATKEGYQKETVRYEKVAITDPKTEKEIIKAIIRQDLDVAGVMTPEKLHRIFDKLRINYDEHFAKFLSKYIDQIEKNPILYDRIGNIQERYPEIKEMSPGKEITPAVALVYITSQKYRTVPGFEKGAEYARMFGYSPEKYHRAVAIWDEARRREASSIPRVVETLENGWSYEVLRLDDPLGIFVEELTNCCQALNGAGESSMEHSMKRPNGRVLVIRDNNGEIAAQGWLWEEKESGKRVICIDNIEVSASKRSSEDKAKIKETLETFVAQLVKTDGQRMARLLKEGRITQKQYESNQLTTVTIGLGHSDIKFSDKQRVRVYTDAGAQAILYEREVDTMKANLATEILALHQDELDEKAGKQISPTDIKTIKNIEREAYNDNPELLIMGQKRTVEELGKLYGYKLEEMHLIKGVDWYMVYAETAEKVHILDTAKTPKSGIVRKSAQEREAAYKMILEKALAGKILITEARESTAYKTVQRMIARKQNRYDIQVIKDQKSTDFRNEASHHLMLSVSERKGRGEPTNSSKWAFGG
jgi:hypothetical protein